MEKRTPKTEEEARMYAIDWQNWVSEQNLSTQELLDWHEHFEEIAKEFDMVEEFTENAII